MRKSITIGIVMVLLLAGLSSAKPDVTVVGDDYITIKIDDAPDEETESALLQNTGGYEQETRNANKYDDEYLVEGKEEKGKEDKGQVKDDEQESQDSGKKEYRLTKQQIQETGYSGNLKNFAQAFDTQMGSLKMDLKEKVFEEGLTDQVIEQVSDRENAKNRLQAVKNLRVGKTEVVGVIQSLFADEPGILDIAVVDKEVIGMEEDFLKKVYLTAKEGDYKERVGLKKQVEDLSSAIRQQQKFAVNINEDHIRALMRADASAEDIANSIIS